MRHPAYVLFVIFVIMPLNGALLERYPITAFVLIVLQFPWAYFSIIKGLK